jgi:hypothetical protein
MTEPVPAKTIAEEIIEAVARDGLMPQDVTGYLLAMILVELQEALPALHADLEHIGKLLEYKA